MATALEKWRDGHYHAVYGGTRKESGRKKESGGTGKGKSFIYTRRRKHLRTRKVETSGKNGTREVVREGREIIETSPVHEKVLRLQSIKTPREKHIKQEVEKQRAGMPES